MLDSMAELFVALDRSYDIVFINRALAEASGKGYEGFVGKNHWDLWPDMRGTVVEESYERAFRTGVPVRFEYFYPKSEVWIDVNVYPSGDYLHLYFRDITQQKTAEREQTERGEWLRRLIDAIPHIAWATHPNGAMMYINARWREYTGSDGMDLEQIRDAIHPSDLPAVMRGMARTRETGQPVPYELRLKRHDGEFRWFRVHPAPLSGNDGQPLGWIGTSSDVHEEVLARQSLVESEDHHRFRVESSPQIPWLAGPDGMIYEFGSQWLEFTGMSKEEAAASQMTVLHPDDAPGMIERWGQSLASGEPFDYLHRVRARGGEYRWVRTRAVARRDSDGAILRWYGTTEDIHASKSSEERLRQIQEALSLAMKGGRLGWWSRSSDEVQWSPELEALFGLAPGAFQGNEGAFFEYVFEEDQSKIAGAVRTAVETGNDYAVEFRFRRSDGTHGWMEGRGKAIYDEAGAPVWLYGIGIDVTERKEAEEALRGSESRLRSLIEQSPVSIQTFAPDGLALTANRAWQLLWDADLKNLAGYNIRQDPQLFEKGFSAYIEKAFGGNPVRIPPMLYDPAETGRVGRARWVESRAYPVIGAGGELTEVVLLLEDVTSIVESAEALRQSEDRFRTIAESIPQFIFGADADGNTDYCNPQYLEFLGLNATQISEGQWMSSVHPEDLESLIEAWNGALATGTSYETEARRLRASDGSYRWCRTMAKPIRDSEGRVVRWYGVVTDIHDQKEQERTLERLVRERTAELEAAYREQESFSYSVSHDLRAPLRAIAASARILEEDFGGSLPAEARRVLDRQSESAKKLAMLIDDLLQLSRVGRQEIERVPINLSKLFTEVSESIATPAGLHFEIQPGLSTEGDLRLIRLVAQNLLENAAKFSPDGGIIRVGKDSKGFFVSDLGVGFDMAHSTRLFQPFHRLHREEEFKGTGIGLATVRRIVERHQGQVWARSEPGKGATFWFTLA
ncbi:PAS/PAC sensor hybrid histidine kinase [Fimbriimonas ginsengisoli Gsoil 348]|uniref:histidine kinase n=1 Tax=Fimbriimonas ginsengisoli Gsoil 348 TaxID=661478 RepID=A0A068NVV7_FIMGI|nr:PAS/PAC sensor hybrid histidine kinase [Fimbriimonas ginsengisoli Gsoil 348]